MDRLGEALDVASQLLQSIIGPPCPKRCKSRLGCDNNLSFGPGLEGVRGHAGPTDTLVSPGLGLPLIKVGSLAQ